MGKALLNMFLFPLSKERTYLNMSLFYACAQNCTETKISPHVSNAGWCGAQTSRKVSMWEAPIIKSLLWEKHETDLIAHRKLGHLAGTGRPLNHDTRTLGTLRLKETGIKVALPGPHLPLWSWGPLSCRWPHCCCLQHRPRVSWCQQRWSQPTRSHVPLVSSPPPTP